MSASRRGIRTFARRGGRLTPAQRRALETDWPRLGIPDGAGPLDLDALFGRRAPRVLEVGFGAGHALAGAAAAHPERDYLGVEVYPPGIGSLLLRLRETGATNVRVFRGDALAILAERLAPRSLEGILVLFPDPWPKKRHHKRRLVQPAFVDLAHSRLVPGGWLHLATDWLPYAEQMLSVLEAHPGLRNLAGPGRFAPRAPDRAPTRFEARGERLGHEVRDLAFARRDRAAVPGPAGAAMNDPTPEALLDAVVRIGRDAGERIVEIGRRGFDVARKADGSPVTQADVEAHAIIAAGLAALAGYPVLSEEAPAPAPEVRAGWRRYWLVDPLDGTVGFARGGADYAVNIALVEDGVPVLGVVAVPAEGVCYAASRGVGAFACAPDGARRSIHARRAVPGALVVATSRSRRNPLTRAYLERLAPAEVIRVGSAIKTCLVAAGRADAYPGFSRTSEWDTAAPQCVLEEAGGRLMDLAGRPLRYNTRASLENPAFLAVGDPAFDWLAALPPAEGEGPAA